MAFGIVMILIKKKVGDIIAFACGGANQSLQRFVYLD
jgi:hypothetical protein